MHARTHTHNTRNWFDWFKMYRGKGEHSWRSLYNWFLEGLRCKIVSFLSFCLTLSQPLTLFRLCPSVRVCPPAEYMHYVDNGEGKRKGHTVHCYTESMVPQLCRFTVEEKKKTKCLFIFVGNNSADLAAGHKATCVMLEIRGFLMCSFTWKIQNAAN